MRCDRRDVRRMTIDQFCDFTPISLSLSPPFPIDIIVSPPSGGPRPRRSRDGRRSRRQRRSRPPHQSRPPPSHPRRPASMPRRKRRRQSTSVHKSSTANDDRPPQLHLHQWQAYLLFRSISFSFPGAFYLIKLSILFQQKLMMLIPSSHQ